MYRVDAKPDRSLLVVAKDGNVIAVDRRSGEQQWEYRMHRGPLRIVAAADRVFACAGAQLHILDYRTGSVMATSSLPVPWATPASLLVDEGQLFVASGGTLLALSLEGDLLWKQPLEAYGVDDIQVVLMERREAETD